MMLAKVFSILSSGLGTYVSSRLFVSLIETISSVAWLILSIYEVDRRAEGNTQ